MNTYSTKNIRNVVLLGSSKSGKTTLAEALMYEGKVIDRRGTVEGKNTISDNTEVEQINQRSIYATPLYAEFMDNKLNIIDTPGVDDFVGGVISAFKVCDSGVMLINATQGVEVGTEIFGRYAEDYHKPLILGVNQLDNDKANWDGTLDSLHQAFGSKPVVLQFPTATGSAFNGFIDILKMKQYIFKDENGTREEKEIPAEFAGQAEDMKAALMEMAAENDEALMEKFFADGTLSEDDVNKGLKIGFMKGEIYPVFCLSGRKDIGTKRLMEFIIDVCPSPDHDPEKSTEGKEIPCDPNGPTSLFFFKTSMEQHLGEVLYFKVESGKVSQGQDIINPVTDSKERISALYAVAGKQKVALTDMLAGDIGCTVKLKSAKSNQTYNQAGDDDVIAPIVYPQSRYRTAIKPKEEKDNEKLGEALSKANAEDPTILVEYSKELKQTILNGQGELQINLVKWHVNHDYNIECEFLAPKIPYRETITKVSAASYRHKKQSGGAGQFGEVHLLIEPIVEGTPAGTKFHVEGRDLIPSIKTHEEFKLEWGGTWEFNNCVVGGAIDASFMPAIKKGIMQKMEEGPLTGSYARDIRIFVYDGKMHPVDSNEISFILAGRNAFKEAFKNAGPKIMEPIYNIEIMVPADGMGDVMSDLQNRRAIIEGMSSERGFQILKARVPLAELYKYSTTLSSLTSGRATFTMTFAEYQQVPSNVQDQLLKDYEASQTEEE